MSSRPGRPASRPVLIARCLFLACMAIAVLCAATAKADEYKMLGCSASARDPFYTIANNTTSPQNPAGIFNFWNNCSGQGGDPPGESAYLRIEENQANGYAGQYASLGFAFDTPNQFIHFRAAGAYTREPSSFNEGWRSRMWISGGSAGERELMTQGQGLCNCGDQWAPTSTFASHLWPLGGYLDFTHFVWEMQCVRPGGCDRAGVNETDLNGMAFILSDEYRSAVNLTETGAPFLGGRWVRGPQTIGYNWTELGSGMKMERVKIDGAPVSEINHSCNVAWSPTNGEYALTYQPCDTGADVKRGVPVETAGLPDGAHTVAACTQDYAQWDNTGTGSESCDSRVVHTDNTPPGAPAGLEVTSANPARYLPHFGAHWQLPPNQGSPIVSVHYQVLNAAGEVVVPERTVSATDPSALTGIEGPDHPGAYTLKLWLQDGVGFTGPAATAPIPHDTTPPAAPQELSVIGPSSWGPAQGYKLRWQDIADNGSPIDITRYQVVDGSGNVVIPTQTVSGEGVQALGELETPRQRGDYAVRLWLEDEEGNVGAAASAPIPRDTTPPAAPQGISVTPPTTSKAADGFDLRWHDIADSGSPIDAAHYQVLDGAGKVLVPTQTVSGENVQAVPDIETPGAAGSYQLRLWLEDAEGNVGAPVSAPLAYDCVRSEVTGGASLSAGFAGRATQTVAQDQGSTLAGALHGADGTGVAQAPVCLYSRVVTDQSREFLGIALTDQRGNYRFPVPAGPSREVSTIYRPGQRELKAAATLQTVVHPTLRTPSPVVPNKTVAHFEGEIPGPHNDQVVIVLQVKSGKGWLAFRRYRTRDDGHYELEYRFRRTTRPTSYEMRAQVRETVGYPYLQGESDPITLRVVPARARPAAKKPVKAKRRCAKGSRAVKRRGKARCVKAKHRTGSHKATSSPRPGA